MNDDCPKFKIIFLGDQSVGKSSILNRFSQDKFEPNYQATIGLDFHSKNVMINGANVRLLLYDTAGQEKFKSLIPMYIRDANVIIVVYDITNSDSFTHTSHWVNETKDLRREDAIFCLVGNKIDLADKRTVSEEKGKSYAKENGFIFAEVSAKDGLHIQELFNNELFPKIAEKFKISGDDDENVTEDNQGEKNVKLDEGERKKKKEDVVGKVKKKEMIHRNKVK